MALSFQESLALAQMVAGKNNDSQINVMSMDLPQVVAYSEDAGIAPMAADGYSDTTFDDSYPIFADAYNFSVYTDPNYSTIDNAKNITVHSSQINLTQEQNSQYIPFSMPRYWDGYDLSNCNLRIWSTAIDAPISPVNVYYKEDKIYFAWLVDEYVTRKAGSITFEVHAAGVVNDQAGTQHPYYWKSKPGTLTVTASKFNVNEILDEEVAAAADTWLTQLIIEVVNTIASQDISSQVQTAQDAADQAKIAQTQAEADRIKVENKLTEFETITRPQVISDAEKAAKQTTESLLDDYSTDAEVDAKLGELNGKTVRDYVDGAIDEIDVSDQLVNYALKTELNGLASETYVDDAVAAVDVSDQLTSYMKTELANATFATPDMIDEKISNMDLDSKLTNYYTKTEVYSKAEVDEAVSNVTVDLSGYATEIYVDNKLSPISESVATNTSNIASLGTTIAELQEAVDSVDTSPRLTYDVAYNDIEDEDVGENVFVFYEIENEGQENEVKSAKKKFTITGGSGGGSSASVLKIGYITTSPLVVTTNDRAIIKYSFSGTDSSGDIVTEATATWKINGKVIATNTAIAGDNEFDVTDYITTGTQKVLLTVVDSAGSLATKTWNVQQVDVKLECDFNDQTTYPLGPIEFSYKPYGAIDKIVHFKIDGIEIGTVSTKTSGIPMSYTLPAQTHGAHLVEAYITATLNGNAIESNHVFKDVIWYDSTSEVPVISCAQQNFTAKQYDSTNIIYTVFDPKTETPEVSLAVDGSVVSTQKLEKAVNTWQYKSSDVGPHVLTITCGETVKTLNVVVEKLDIDVTPITAGLAFDFNPSGRSNNDTDRLWSDKDVSMTVSSNFDWTNGGYQIDENGDQYFCVKAGTTATINYNLFADDPKKTGKEFKLIFKTTNVRKRSTSFLTCLDGGIGLDLKVESANIYSNNDSLYSPYCEDDVIEFEFNINKDTDIPMVLTYEDGVANRPMIYASNSSFMQSVPQPITIGCDDCDVYIYRMKAYSNSLTDSNILSNFIADARNADEMIARYNRNQIYDENGALDPYVLAKKCPDLRVVLIDAPHFTNDKKDKVSDTNVTMVYEGGDPVLDNWTCTGAQHSGQGTSSNEYGYSGRNLDLIMNKDTSLFTLGDGETTSDTITLTRNSTPTNYLNIKVNIASSENENNAQMTMRYNQYEPYIRPARLKDPKVRDTMEFYNCVVFIRERDEDLSTHREFADTLYHYYALGNIGDSKKTDNTRVLDANDPKEFCVEVMDYNVALAEFPTGYTDAEGNKAICPESEWKPGNEAYDYLYAPYLYEDGEFKSFGSESYEFRYEKKKITEEERQANIDVWREMYKFIVTSDDEAFKANFDKYFVKDSVLYFYLFTSRYLLIDNRAKNLFINYAKAYFTQEEAEQFKADYGVDIQSEFIDNAQAAIRDGYRFNFTWGYDFDSCLGIDNTGKLALTYGQEDTDYYTDGDPASGYIYRAAESTFWCRVRDLFPTELAALFVECESNNAWSATSLINQWDTAQTQFPEEVWRLDTQRKYLRTYQGVSIDNSIAGEANERFLKNMLNGRKKYQRRMFERNQELYFATKYFGNTATQDQIMMRFNKPQGKETNYTLYITPYSDMYIGVRFGNFAPTNFRAKAGQQYTVPYTLDTADITLIYGASFIQAIGDLSKCYVGDNDFSKATRLQSLSIGSGEKGYSNSFMTSIGLGNNKLLEYLDLRNITGLNSTIDLSQCNSLLELQAQGTNARGVIFANEGKIKKAYLPDITSLTVKNLNYLEVFDLASTEKLQSLIVENTPFINTYDLINSSPALRTVRLVGMNWDSSYFIADSTILNRLLKLRGIGNDGYETTISSLAGCFFAAVVRQQELKTFNETWKDLEIAYSTLVEQYPVTFVNDDDTVLEVQYVDKGGYPSDPLKREENPLPIPKKESSISTDYTFIGWDTDVAGIQIFEPKTIRATYSESVREYTVKYVSKGTVLQTTVGAYGSNVPYTGEMPTYNLEEGGYHYYLFNRWNKSGLVDGNKTIEAVYDTFDYVPGCYAGKQLSDLKPVEIYALSKLVEESKKNNIDETFQDLGVDIEVGDAYSFTMGYDIEFDDIDSVELINSKTSFDGSNYLDFKEIKLFQEDKDFVLAVDYKLDGTVNTNGKTLFQCFQNSGSNGFKMSYNNNSAQVTWGGSSKTISNVDSREMVVLRHVKGDNNLYVYMSHLDTVIEVATIEKSTATQSDIATLVFGAVKNDQGRFVNNAVGDIYWAKVWYCDLGEDVCKQLVGWTHEQLSFEVDGFYRYALAEDFEKASMFSLLGTHLLENTREFNKSKGNEGGWKESDLKAFLNNRFYNAFPNQIKALVKEVTVASTQGVGSQEPSQSGCHVNIPALYDLDKGKSDYASEVSDSNGTIAYMTSNEMRRRALPNGNYAIYWTRSPNFSYTSNTNYMWVVKESGVTEGFSTAATPHGILIEISF